MKSKKLLSTAMAVAMSLSAMPATVYTAMPVTSVAAESSASQDVIIHQPQDCYINAAKNVTFSIKTNGDNFKYQWEYSKDGGKTWIKVVSNGTSASYTTSGSSARNGWAFRCNVMNASGSVVGVSDEAYIRYGNAALNITKQPADVTIDAAKNVSFSVSAEGTGLKYQWEYSKDGGNSWIKVVSNGTSASFSTSGSASRNGWLFRCNVTSGSNTIKSNPAAIIFNNNNVNITKQPENVTISENKNVTFSVGASGSTLKYQWEYSKDGGKSWIKVVSNGTSASYTTAGSAARNGWLFRCNVTSGSKTVTSDAAAIIFGDSKVEITKQPENVNISENKNVTFSVGASGSALKYQWEYSKDGGNSWIKVVSNGTSASFSTSGSAARNGWLFRCNVTSGSKTVTTDAAAIIFEDSKVEITKQPENVTISETQNVTFSVGAAGNALKYQWEYSKDGGKNWIKVTSKGTSDSYTTSGSAARDGWLFRCNVTSGSNTVTTNAASINYVDMSINIIQQPDNVTISENTNVIFAVEAEGREIKYQWEYSKDGGNTWIKVVSNGTSSFFKTSASEARDGWLFRCNISNSVNTVVSKSAKIIFKEKEVLPREITIKKGDTYQLDITGNGYSYLASSGIISVNSRGEVTAHHEGDALIFATSKTGNKAVYKIHVREEHKELAFEKNELTLKPDETRYLYANKYAEYLSSDAAKLYVSQYNYDGICRVSGHIPGEYYVVGYTDDGEMTTASVTVEGDVNEAVNGTEYTGEMNEDTDVWYKYTNTSDVWQLITFDTLTSAEVESMVDAKFMTYTGNEYSMNDYYGTSFETAQIFLGPGEDMYVRVQNYYGYIGEYGFILNATDYNTADYTIGTQQQNIPLDRKDFTGYTFTTSEPGSYKLTLQSRTGFQWQLQDNANNSEIIQSGWDSGVITFDLERNKDYTLRFIPSDPSESGTLKFKLEKVQDNIVEAEFNTDYEEIIESGQPIYFKYELDGSWNDVFELVYDKNNSGIKYQILSDDMFSEYESYESPGGRRLYMPEGATNVTIYIKVTENGSYDAYFNLKKFERSICSTTDDTESSDDIGAYEAKWYEFTAPETGNYNFNFSMSDGNVYLDFEVHEVYDDGSCYYDGDASAYYTSYINFSRAMKKGETIGIKVTGNFNSGNDTERVEYNWNISCVESYEISELQLDTPIHGINESRYTFTAPESGTYYFWSESSYDTYGYLRDLHNINIARDDDGGYSGNFLISYNIRKGETVNLIACGYNGRDCEYDVVVSTRNRCTEFASQN